MNDLHSSASSKGRPVTLGTKLFSLLIEDGVAFVTYDVPGEPVNTLRAETAGELDQVLTALEDNSAVQAVVLLSAKVDSFVAGADLELLRTVRSQEEAEGLSRTAQRGFARLAAFPKPVVAALHGACLGGGFELALACHGRIASDSEKTVLGLPEVKLGLLPGGNGLLRLADLIGVIETLDLGLTGKNLRPKKAKRMGVVADVVPVAILRSVAKRYALRLVAERAAAKSSSSSKGPRGNVLRHWLLEKTPLGQTMIFRQARATARKKGSQHYPAVGHILTVLETYGKDGWDAASQREAASFGELVVSETAARLTEIFFATQALKKDTGVDELDITPRSIEKVAVLGAGLMGAGIAYVTTDAGIAVRLKDRDDSALDRGLRYVADRYRTRVRRGQLDRTAQRAKNALLTATTDFSGVANADVVIEAVFEDLLVKRAVIREVETVTKPETIFASNTSSIPLAQIAAASSRPANVVGMHYFSPVDKMPLLEVVRTEQTAPWVIATAVALGKQQGKTVIVVRDGVGFYTTRTLSPYLNEAAYLLTEGVPIDEIDRALIAWGWPVGPLALLDEVGIDVASHVGPILVAALGSRLTPPAAFAKLVADDRQGRKNRRGFYLYGDAAQRARWKKPFGARDGKPVDTSVYELLGVIPTPDRVPVEEVQLRCSLQFLNEAAYCYGEGILRSVRDGDIGAVFGLGFPPFRGGPFRTVDALGVSYVLRQIRAYEDRFGARWTPAPALVELERKGGKFYEK